MEGIFLFETSDTFIERTLEFVKTRKELSARFHGETLNITLKIPSRYLREGWHYKKDKDGDCYAFSNIDVFDDEDYQDSFDPGVVDSIRNKYQFKKGYAIEFNRLEMMDYMIVELFDPGSVINIFYDDLFSVRDLKEEFALNSNLNKFHEQFNDDDEY